MNKKFINDNIEEVLIRLLTIEWYLETLKAKDICAIQCLLDLFKKEIKSTLKALEKFYFGFSSPDILVLEKVKKQVKRKKKATKEKSIYQKMKDDSILLELIEDPRRLPPKSKKKKKETKNAVFNSRKIKKKSTKNKKSKK